ncbi:hypothetical protein [Demequina sp. NBRC 110055]|uniref:hypothetical protein n=1 Tax=Demequina sp. NBRC 110055 TaxID=1570344 RepID=UPI000A02B174|nr:hypothetical protein [Demequina sp. NBRC 110055]
MRPTGWWLAAIIAACSLNVAWLVTLLATIDGPPAWLDAVTAPLVMLTGAVVVAWMTVAWVEAERRTGRS